MPLPCSGSWLRKEAFPSPLTRLSFLQGPFPKQKPTGEASSARSSTPTAIGMHSTMMLRMFFTRNPRMGQAGIRRWTLIQRMRITASPASGLKGVSSMWPGLTIRRTTSRLIPSTPPAVMLRGRSAHLPTWGLSLQVHLPQIIR